MPVLEDVCVALKGLIDAVSVDMNGVSGMPMSGNGGLISDETMRKCDEARVTLARYGAQQGIVK